MPLSHRPRRPYARRMRASVDSADFSNPGAPDPAGASTASRPDCYTNPILDADFPDPAIILAPDDYYYAYGTQTLRDGHWINIQVARSRDLIHWEQLGDALPTKPDWAQTTQDFWAPRSEERRVGKECRARRWP